MTRRAVLTTLALLSVAVRAAPVPVSAPADFVLERPAGELRGSVLLVHGSAPFDRDGRIPGGGTSPYADEPFFRDLAAALRAQGWATLRYDKPGVGPAGVDSDRYSRTDLADLSSQLRRLWTVLPAEKPRIVFAWSEGTLHVGALPAREIAAVMLLGAIATGLGDAVEAQGGPPAAMLRKELEAKDRRAMLGVDRPAGRALDELALGPNWRTFAAVGAPMLVLHGGADRDVPVRQAALWQPALPGLDLTVKVGEGLDHRFMTPGRYEPERPAAEIAAFLERVLPREGRGRGGPK